MNPRRKVVVTGLGLVTSLGITVEESWQKALAGVSGVHRLTEPRSQKSPVQAVGEVCASERQRIEEEFKEDAPLEGERKTRFALWAAKRAIEDADLFKARGSRDRYGVVLASGLGINRLEDIQMWVKDRASFDVARFGQEYTQVQAESIIRNNSNRTAALVSSKFGLTGVNCTVTSACASGTQAAGIGFRAVQRGDADLVLDSRGAGGEPALQAKVEEERPAAVVPRDAEGDLVPLLERELRCKILAEAVGLLVGVWR